MNILNNFIKLRREAEASLSLLHSTFPAHSSMEMEIPSEAQRSPAGLLTGSISPSLNMSGVWALILTWFLPLL